MGKPTIASVLPGIVAGCIPIILLPTIFLFAAPISVWQAAVIVGLLILWLLALVLTITFLANQHKAHLRQVQSGEYWAAWRYSHEEMTQTLMSSDQVLLGPLGIFWPGNNPLLMDFGDELLGVDVIRERRSPPMLQFKFRAKRYSVDGYSASSLRDYVVSFANFGTFGRIFTVNIPIPQGHEDEAEELGKRFRAKFVAVPFGTFIDRWLSISVYIACVILYIGVIFLVISPPR